MLWSNLTEHFQSAPITEPKDREVPIPPKHLKKWTTTSMLQMIPARLWALTWSHLMIGPASSLVLLLSVDSTDAHMVSVRVQLVTASERMNASFCVWSGGHNLV